MKIGIMHRSVVAPGGHSLQMGILCLICIIVSSAHCASAGSIFDDDWTPPKPVVRPHAAPAQPPPVTPKPAPAEPHPAVTPPATAQPAVAPPATAQPAAAPQAQAPARAAIPGRLEQARSRGLLKEAFAAQLKDRTIGGRKKLAQTLLDEVPKTADNPSDEFVLLGGAIDASKEAGTLRLCFAAADLMAAQYDVDALSIKIEAVLRVNLRGDSPATAAENVRAALELIDPLLAAEEFATASRILSLARPAAAGDPALLPVVQKRMQMVESLRAAHDRLSQFVEKLKTSPDDPAANLAVGSYNCFNRGDWENGLPMLAKGSDAYLKQLATLELAHPTTPDDVTRIADRWWDFGAKQPDLVRGEIYQHAAGYYRAALDSATGLRRTLMEHRIADAGVDQTTPRRPSSVITHGTGDTLVNSIGMKFVRINAGEFMMGSPATEAGRSDNETLHHVKITRAFLMATTPVTQAQWKAIMGKNPSHVQANDNPVETVSWDDAVAFCEKLGAKDRVHYRLPTEAEWEYACRAGTETPYGGTNNLDEMGWYVDNCNKQTHPVAQKKPNAWGLYDMHGNVWQWCSDANGPYDGDAVDPKGGNDTTSRINRGGSWANPAPHCRAAYRKWNAPGGWDGRIGFRVVVDIPGQQAAVDVVKPAPPTPTPHIDPAGFTNLIGMKLVRINAGEFMMGSPANEADHEDHETLHHVKISKAFLMAITTVTQGQWKAVMGNNPSHFQGDQRPVEMVSWAEAKAFCEKLSAKEGRRYRLPTEAEWEYACRAGTQTPYSFGDEKIVDFAWYNGNSEKQTHEVATKKPNAWGLYDMQGNVCQRCSDGYAPYGGDAVDPKGGDGSLGCVIRGGSWNDYPRAGRAAWRMGSSTGYRGASIGFRVCMDF